MPLSVQQALHKAFLVAFLEGLEGLDISLWRGCGCMAVSKACGLRVRVV